MISGYIRLSEVLDHMDMLDGDGNPVAFDIKFVTADEKRNTGGQIISLQGVKKCVGKRDGKVIYDTRPKNELNVVTKNPHHWEHATRNLILPNGQIRKCHIRLIIEFNGKKVCY
jgi:hypothetical protein